MSNKKFTCGRIDPSGCILLTADLPSFVDVDLFPCDATIDDLFAEYNNTIEKILSSIDITGLNKHSFVFDPVTAKVKDVLQEGIVKISALETALAALQIQLDTMDVGTETITIDLGCLAPDAAPCETAPNTYTLLSILTLFKNEICLLKA